MQYIGQFSRFSSLLYTRKQVMTKPKIKDKIDVLHFLISPDDTSWLKSWQDLGDLAKIIELQTKNLGKINQGLIMILEHNEKKTCCSRDSSSLAFTHDPVNTTTAPSDTLPTYWKKDLDINRKVG